VIFSFIDLALTMLQRRSINALKQIRSSASPKRGEKGRVRLAPPSAKAWRPGRAVVSSWAGR
jgi:hypothetical protein